MSTVDQRAQVIYDWLHARQGKKFTLPQLCAGTGLRPGAKTTAAIRRARDLATAAGLHFPPAVPANKFTYTVTSLPGEALDPALHMSRTETGVRTRGDVGYDFMRQHERDLPRDLKPMVKAALAVRDSARQAQAAMQRAFDDMVIEMVKIRRGTRDED